MGKTAFALNIAQHIAINKKIPTAIFSLEMSKEQLGLRMYFSEAGINLGRYKTGQLEDCDWDNLTSVMSEITDAQNIGKIAYDTMFGMINQLTILDIYKANLKKLKT